MLQPLGDRIVITIDKREESVGGIVLAATGHEATKTASVVAVGEGVRALNGELVAPSVKVGDTVLVEGHAGVAIKDGDQEVHIIHEAEILAIVK